MKINFLAIDFYVENQNLQDDPNNLKDAMQLHLSEISNVIFSSEFEYIKELETDFEHYKNIQNCIKYIIGIRFAA